MLSRIDHVGIAVRDLDQAIEVYERRLGLRASGRERLENEGIEIAMIPIGESRIELITPLNAQSKVEKFLQDRGEAVHHVAFATSDVGASLARAAPAGGQLLDEVARPGAHGTLIGFVHPKSISGVLTGFPSACDRPTQRGDGAAAMWAPGEVGKVGVSSSSLKDMRHCSMASR